MGSFSWPLTQVRGENSLLTIAQVFLPAWLSVLILDGETRLLDARTEMLVQEAVVALG